MQIILLAFFYLSDSVIDLPYGGCFSSQMTHFHLHCMVEEVEVGSRHGDQVTQMAGCVEVVEPDPGQSAHSRYPVDLCCVCAAAHSSSSFPKLLSGNCHRNDLALSWHRGHDGPAPDP